MLMAYKRQVSQHQIGTSQNYDTYFNNQNDEIYIGRRIDNGGSPSGEYLDGYLSEFILIDGLQLTPSSFGETDSNGVWVPKVISGLTFGNNGFKLDFADASDLGDDESGNGGDFTENNLTSIDKSEDTPQNNYAVLNSAVGNEANLSSIVMVI